jgi:hypothetical protein
MTKPSSSSFWGAGERDAPGETVGIREHSTSGRLERQHVGVLAKDRDKYV